MATLVWDQETDKKATYGVNHVVFWPKVKANKYSNENQAYGTPVAWSGVAQISIDISANEGQALYVDGIQYNRAHDKEQTVLNIKCFTFPEEFETCLGFEKDTHTNTYSGVKKKFAISWQTWVIDANGNKETQTFFAWDCEVTDIGGMEYSTYQDSVNVAQFDIKAAIGPQTSEDIDVPTHYVCVDSATFTDATAKARWELYLTEEVWNSSIQMVNRDKLISLINDEDWPKDFYYWNKYEGSYTWQTFKDNIVSWKRAKGSYS